jgi:carbonic anhydrase
MQMVEPLLKGVAKFQRGYFRKNRERYADLVKDGQKPSTLFITCADSRVMPDTMTGANPGELFVVRNVGNMVPAHSSGSADPGVGSAVEYAVSVLNVSQIVICGHSHCGACAALYGGCDDEEEFALTRKWLEQGRRVKEIVLEKAGSSPDEVDLLFGSHKRREEVLRATERAMVVQHVRNLLGYPLVERGVAEGRLAVHGWYYTLETGEVEMYDADRLAFLPLSRTDAVPRLSS